MRKTDGLKLSLLELGDKVSVEPFNENARVLEDALTSIGRRNFLDNWFFADPVNQRGQEEYAGGASYSVDRWSFAGGNTLIRLDSAGLSFVKNSESPYQWIQQIVEIPAGMAGAKMTASIFGKSEGSVRLRVFSNSSSGESLGVVDQVLDGVCSISFCVPEDAERLLVLFYPHFYTGIVSGVTTMFAAKLELGSTQTLVHKNKSGVWELNDLPPNKNAELIKCCISTADPADTYANNRKTPSAVGAAKVVTGSYVGTGVCGQSNPCILTFDFEPKLVMVYSASLGAGFGTKFNSDYHGAILAAKGTADAKRTDTVISNGGSVTKQEVTDRYTWGDNSFAWYSSTSVAGYSMTAAGQMNDSGVTYHYLAIG